MTGFVRLFVKRPVTLWQVFLCESIGEFLSKYKYNCVIFYL